MSRQKQPLELFSDRLVLSDSLLKNSPSSVLITSVDATQPAWLITGLIEQILAGSSKLNKESRVDLSGTDLYVISFENGAEKYQSLFKKITGKDLIFFKNYHFIDCFSGLFDTHLKGNISDENVVGFLKSRIGGGISTKKNILLIENPEFLLASTKLAPLSLIKFLHSLQTQGLSQVQILTCKAEKELLNFALDSHESIELKNTVFLAALHSKSIACLSLRPLSTGRADDVSGSLTIARGMVGLDDIEVAEKSYLYLVKKDGSADLFYK